MNTKLFTRKIYMAKENIRTKKKEQKEKFLEFLTKKGECFVINRHSDFSKLDVLLMDASIDTDESCGVAVTGCYKNYAAIMPGKRRLLVSRSLMDLFCEENNCDLEVLIEKRYVYRTTMQSWLANKQRVAQEKKGRKKGLGWVERTRMELKKKSTKYERIVLKELKRVGFVNIDVQYNVVVNGHLYFLDIYLNDYKVAIEVDGGYHEEELQQLHDKERDRLLLIAGIKTLRIKNEDVLNPDKLSEFINKISLI